MHSLTAHLWAPGQSPGVGTWPILRQQLDRFDDDDDDGNDNK